MVGQTVLGAVSALALIIAVPALAQEPLRAGQSLQGELTGSGESVQDDYRITARAGQRFEVTMRSDAFDAYLEVFRDGELEESIASDDDGLGEGTHSRLRFTAPSAGTYILRARSLSGSDTGAYALAMTDRGAAPRPPRPTGIRLGQTLNGELSGRDPESDDGRIYDAFSFRAAQGERFSIAADAENLDTTLRVGRMQGNVFNELGYNDDGPDSGVNPRLVFTAPSAGEFIIRVAPLSAGGEGDYTVSLEAGPEPMAAQSIAIGDKVDGELSDDDGKNAAGQTADAYRFSGREGQRIRIDMTSSAFDTYLELLDQNEASLVQDDDGGPEGTNSRITFTLPSDGDYVVQARAFGGNSTGAYTLSIEEVAPPPPPLALAFGATVQGEIGEESPKDDEDRGYQDYSFTATEGQRVQAIARSGDFDTFLQISRAGEFASLGSDDDGLGEGTDSRLNYVIEEAGDYVVRVSPLSAKEDGLYSIELIDRGPQPQPGSILVGATAPGTLSETDATAEDNSYFDAYRITLKEDETIIVTMVSNEIDSFVVVGRPNDEGGIEVLGSDDDSLSDRHAKLEWTAPSDGTYEIRAGSFQQGETGRYALTVAKKAAD